MSQNRPRAIIAPRAGQLMSPGAQVSSPGRVLSLIRSQLTHQLFSSARSHRSPSHPNLPPSCPTSVGEMPELAVPPVLPARSQLCRF
jgi:hypothetical protein